MARQARDAVRPLVARLVALVTELVAVMEGFGRIQDESVAADAKYTEGHNARDDMAPSPSKKFHVKRAAIALLLSACNPTDAAQQPRSTGAQLAQYVVCYATAMEMADWRLYVNLTRFPDSVGWIAEADADPTYKTATLSFDTVELQGEDVLQRQSVVHELWHVLLWEPMELAEAQDYDRATVLQEQLNTRIERWPFWLEMCQ